MKYLVLASFAIIFVLCQAPNHDPANSKCTASKTCVTTGCGNATAGADPNKYCGNAATTYCDYLNAGACLPKKAVGQSCNASYYNQDCLSPATCVTGTCTAGATTTAAPTTAIAYEGNSCASTSCHPSLSCVSGNCQKYFANSAACVTALDCSPGNLCLASVCTAQSGSKLIGAACAQDTDCTTPAVCVCNSVGASAGACGALDATNGLAFTQAAITNCKALLNQYKNGGTITASNAATALTNYGCVTNCFYTNGPSAVTSAWAGYNYVYAPFGTINNCVYTPPTTCANPTTTGPTKASATSVIASLFLTVLALLF